MPSGNGSCTILIVDDDVAILRLLRRVLEADGFHVLEAGSGEDALKVGTKNTFDLAVIDYVMPGMNGAEVLSELRKLNPAAYLIMISGFPKQVAEGKTNTTIPEDTPFLAKPFTPRQLLGEIKRAPAARR